MQAGQREKQNRMEGMRNLELKKRMIKKPEIADQTDNKEYNGASDKKSKQAWARLIKKIYEIDPLVCPKCGSEMKIVVFFQYFVVKLLTGIITFPISQFIITD
jgi:hypothetical protein